MYPSGTLGALQSYLAMGSTFALRTYLSTATSAAGMAKLPPVRTDFLFRRPLRF
jgi:hypothetical protein